MYYKILINDNEVGVFGHEDVENIHVSVSGLPGRMAVFASAVCKEDGQRIFCDWLQHDVSDRDVVLIEPTTETNVPSPRKRYVMEHGKRDASLARRCDFCEREESEDRQVLYSGENRPSICSSCADLCSRMLSSSAADQI